MTTIPPSAPLCPHCGRRPVTRSVPDRTTEPPTTLNLCEPCFAEEMRRRLKTAVRQWGAEVEAAFGETGSDVPGGLSGEEFASAMFVELQRLAQTPEMQARAQEVGAAIQQIRAQLARELPGGFDHPEFREQMLHRIRQWMEDHDVSGGDASA